jgi:tRNA(Met) cytidine acetyltransferase
MVHYRNIYYLDANASMNQYLRNLYLVKSDPDLMRCCMQTMDQYCKTLNEYTSSTSVSHAKNKSSSILWISETSPEAMGAVFADHYSSMLSQRMIKHIQPKHYRQILGQEFSLIIYDISLGIRANPFYAVIGTLQLGGALLLLAPSDDTKITDSRVNSIARLPSALPQSYSSQSNPAQNNEQSYFNQLFASLVECHFPHSALSPSIITEPEQSRAVLKQWHDIQHQRITQTLPEEIANQLCAAIHSQVETLESIFTQIDAGLAVPSANNHHVLQADRGRGKSDLLGQLAARFVNRSETSPPFTDIIIITQSNESANTIRNGLYRFDVHSNALLNVPLNAHEIRRELKGVVNVRFCAPDDPRLFAPNSDTHLLLIDEAASLPVYWLHKAVQSYSNIVFATTTHGYENNGMGFSLAFLPTLQDAKYHFLTNPIRFIAPCPLEQFAQALLSPGSLEPTKDETQPVPSLTLWPDGLHSITHSQLIEQPQLRVAVMQCLMQAHYQTAPDDLQRLLDAPDMSCYVYVREQQLLGCIWIVEEGEFTDSSLMQAISAGTRRVSGHLSLQQLAYSYNEPSILTIKAWRVNRIAVLPPYQAQGIGTSMLAALYQQAAQHDVDVITSAFGASQRLLSFWQRNQFTLLKLGQQRNTVTGLNNAIIIRQINNASAPVDIVNMLNNMNLWFSMSQEFSAITHGQEPAKTHLDYLGHLDHFGQKQCMSALQQFIDSERNIDYVEHFIYAYLRYILPQHGTVSKVDKNNNLLTRRYVEGHSFASIIKENQYTGKKALIIAIRHALSALL